MFVLIYVRSDVGSAGSKEYTTELMTRKGTSAGHTYGRITWRAG